MTQSNETITLQSGIKAFRSGDRSAARALFDSVLSLEPLHNGALHHLGLLERQAGNLAAAIVEEKSYAEYSHATQAD